jgi:hypothetical protein
MVRSRDSRDVHGSVSPAGEPKKDWQETPAYLLLHTPLSPLSPSDQRARHEMPEESDALHDVEKYVITCVARLMTTLNIIL